MLRLAPSLFALGLTLPSSALATDYLGADWGGADLDLVDGDGLSGTFTNVGTLTIAPGANVRVSASPLEIHADLMFIDGTLAASGAGEVGGIGAVDEGGASTPGSGLGGGTGGFPGPCVHGGGAGGGGYGSSGGMGYYWFVGSQALGGPAYGDPADPTNRPVGSGGGGAGGSCDGAGGNGGAGGGSIYLTALEVHVSGAVRVQGQPGEDHIGSTAGGGGGGSGGTLVIETTNLVGTGTLSARGGDGGDAGSSLSGGGGGGSGGRVKLWFTGTQTALSIDVGGGLVGAVPTSGYGEVGQNGQPGTVDAPILEDDNDGDGFVGTADCDDDDPAVGLGDPEVDTDGDGTPDCIDPCPDDPDDDSDGDGVCDSDDLCPGGDDAIDEDQDGIPDDCAELGTTGSSPTDGSPGGPGAPLGDDANHLNGCLCDGSGSPGAGWWTALPLAIALRRRRTRA